MAACVPRSVARSSRKARDGPDRPVKSRMMQGRLSRLRRMTFDEGRWRASEMARTFGDRARSRLTTPRWRREDIGRVLAADVLDAAMRDAIARQDWADVDGRLADGLARRRSRCVIDPVLVTSVRRVVSNRWPGAAADATARADRIVAGTYDLLGYRGLRFTDWHSDPVHHRQAPRICWAEVPYLDPAIGDHKIIWELNRHQHWLQLGRAWWLTGDERYARAVVEQLESWLAENPPLTGINWSSMLEIGFRTISWTMAAHFLAAGSGQQAAGSKSQRFTASCRLPAASFLIAIDHQLRHVEHHLSYYFSPNTHLTGEALALYVVGHAFPELAASERWIATGRRILLQEIDRQILPDGGHAERSTHYQRYTLDFYLLALLTARRTADVDAARTFGAVVAQLAEFTRAMADADGRLPLIGDDDGGMLWPIAGRECNDVRDSLAVAAVALDRPGLAAWGIPEEGFWVAAPQAIQLAADRRPQPPPDGSGGRATAAGRTGSKGRTTATRRSNTAARSFAPTAPACWSWTSFGREPGCGIRDPLFIQRQAIGTSILPGWCARRARDACVRRTWKATRRGSCSIPATCRCCTATRSRVSAGSPPCTERSCRRGPHASRGARACPARRSRGLAIRTPPVRRRSNGST